jgi:hypothetical protein
MTIALDPDAIWSAWKTCAGRGVDELDSADRLMGEASGSGMDDLAGCLTSAAETFSAVAETARALVTELDQAVEGCLALWEATDHQTCGTLNALEDAS